MAVRSLSAYELEEAQSVFRDGLDYVPIKIRERNKLALTVAKGWSKLMRRPDPESNAMTLGNNILVSRRLRTDRSESHANRLIDMAWLIHELTHVWQFQRYRWRYLGEAIAAQAKIGENPYIYSRADSLAGKGDDLSDMWDRGKRLSDFNREQQGDITRDFYRALKSDINTPGWEPLVEEMRLSR